MFQLLMGLADIILNCIGFMALLSVIWVFVGVQKKTLFVKSFSLFGYEVVFTSEKGKELTIKVGKK